MRSEGVAPRIVVRTAGRTDRGIVRQRNEDAFALVDLTTGEVVRDAVTRVYSLEDRGALFMVADGMGGAAGGAVASEMAIEIVLGEVRRRRGSAANGNPEAFAAAIRIAVERANARIHDQAVTRPAGERMGTTATVAGLLDDTLYIAQIGDSRAYLVRDGRAHQITKDQSLVQELIECGELTPEEAAASEHRHIVLQALGPEPGVTVDLTRQPVRQRDVLVLCTDGLSGIVSDDEIAETVSRELDLDVACQRLVDRANEKGGPDNITVIVARLEGPGLTPAAEGDAVGHRTFVVGGTDSASDHAPASANLLGSTGQALGDGSSWVLRIAAAIVAVLVFILILYAVSTWRAGV